MLKTNDIIDEFDNRLREISEEVTFPLSKQDKEMINQMLEHLYNSQLEDMAKKYDLRPGMGLAGIQVGIKKRFFVVCYEEKENMFKNYVIVNPKLISHSEEKIFVGGGEGCLSVNREVEGIVPRYARITITGYDEDGNPLKIRAREELSVVFQHEIDHLNGILFVDHIDSNDPYKNEEYMREI